MKVNGKAYRTIRPLECSAIEVIDQTLLPWAFKLKKLSSSAAAGQAISDMVVRGAPLIGATAAYGVALAMNEDSSDAHLQQACAALLATRPTAVNLQWALQRMHSHLAPLPTAQRTAAAWLEASAICEQDVALNAAIGQTGLAVIQQYQQQVERRIHILTHCNAGWLGTVDWGTALSPIYMAQQAALDVHVWVDETRPRNQGMLTAWELQHQAIKHTYIVDNAGGLLMQRGQVDMVIVGCDRVAANGDVCNKIGTYLKALAARDNGIPFYVALPSPTYDAALPSGSHIPIEERDQREVSHIGAEQIVPTGTDISNLGFDITPAELVTGYLTERGLLTAAQLATLTQA